MSKTHIEDYRKLMNAIRVRFDLITQLKSIGSSDFVINETCAFNARKIIEGIAFGCLVALENGIEHIPNDLKKQYNAGDILKSLQKKNLGGSFPSPSIIRKPTDVEIKETGAKAILDGQPNRRLEIKELVAMYARMHRWSHELSPYTSPGGHEEFLSKNGARLWQDIERLWVFIESHVISINKTMFFCVLKDNADGTVKVISCSKQV